MRKKVLLVVVVCVLLVLFIIDKTSDYSIKYEIDGFQVTESFKKNKAHFIIEKDDKMYDYLYFHKRFFDRKIVSSIHSEEVNGYLCLKPNINGLDGYYICSNGEENITREVLDKSIVYEESSKDFKFNSLDNNEYMLIWKYDGFYYLNGNEMKSINLFNSERYSNDLMFKIDNYIVFPKYENNYLFNTFIILDMTTGKYKEVETKYSINYDSYYVGNNKNSLYLFDNKNENLYEINYKKNKVDLVGSSIRGFIKYENGREKNAKLEEYTKDKITYFDSEEELVKVNNNVISYNDYELKYSDYNVNATNVIDDKVYYVYKDNVYKYEKGRTTLVCHYFELNFNSEGRIFVYSK